MTIKDWLAAAAATALFGLATMAAAEEQTAPPQGRTASEYDVAFQAASAALKAGPTDVAVAGQAKLHLPDGFGYIPPNEAKRVLQAMGNTVDDSIHGMVVPTTGDKANWFVVVSFINAGYIKDDDAKDWNADELLESIKSGTQEANETRKSRGIPEMEIIGWVEKPQYEAAAHRLVWSISSRDKGGQARGDEGVNYNTLALGREGYISMNLVTDLAAVEQLKPTAKTLLGALDFDQGKRYADFDSSKDKVAEYGLAALVAGVAAKKLGMFALIAAFVAKFAKVIGIAVLAGGATIFKVFKRKKSDTGEA